MTEEKKYQLAAEYGRMENEVERERHQGFNRIAEIIEERMAKIEAEFHRNDCDINDYRVK